MPPAKIPMVQAPGLQYKDFGRDLLKNDVRVVFAADYVGVFEDAERARRYEFWWRTQTIDSNFEVFKQLTSTAGKLLVLSGQRNPYPEFKLIETLHLVMKDGDIYRNDIDGRHSEAVEVPLHPRKPPLS